MNLFRIILPFVIYFCGGLLGIKTIISYHIRTLMVLKDKRIVSIDTKITSEDKDWRCILSFLFWPIVCIFYGILFPFNDYITKIEYSRLENIKLLQKEIENNKNTIKQLEHELGLTN